MRRENIPLLISPKSAPSSRHPASSKRGVRVVTIRGVRGAVDAIASRARGIAGRSRAWSCGCERLIRAGRAALLRTAKACGSGTRGWCQAGGGFRKPNRVRKTVNPAATEAKGIRLRGERAISRQTIAQGRPDALRWTCMLVCALPCAIAHETAGAARTRSSLRPCLGESFGQASGASRGEIADAYSVVIGRFAASAKAPASQRGKASAKPWRSRDRAIQYSRDGSD